MNFDFKRKKLLARSHLQLLTNEHATLRSQLKSLQDQLPNQISRVTLSLKQECDPLFEEIPDANEA
jgi:hypothetical protein